MEATPVYVLVNRQGTHIPFDCGCFHSPYDVARHWRPGTFWGMGQSISEALCHARLYVDGSYRRALDDQMRRHPAILNN